MKIEIDYRTLKRLKEKAEREGIELQELLERFSKE